MIVIDSDISKYTGGSVGRLSGGAAVTAMHPLPEWEGTSLVHHKKGAITTGGA
jgi:hypothetical protein